MPLIAWNESLSVSVPEFDEQHKKLIAIVNDLHDAMQKGQGREGLGALLNALVQYTVTHFAAEEKRLSQASYPGYLSHKGEHDELTRKVQDLKKRFDSGNAALTVEVMAFLKNWLTNHIQGTDKKYGAFFAQHALAGTRA